MSNTPMKHSIRARILAILGIMAVSYLLLLTTVQFTAGATHGHMERLSVTLFPAALQIQKAEISFQQQQKRYQDAVLLEDASMVGVGDKDANAVASDLDVLQAGLAGSPRLSRNADDIVTQFSSIRARAHQTYAALVAGGDNIPDTLQEKVAALATDNRRLTATMQDLDKALTDQSSEEFQATELWSSHTRLAGWVMLIVALLGCSSAWWVLQYKVILPLDRLARRMRDIAEGGGDLTERVEVFGRDEFDTVGHWFNIFIERIEQTVLRVTRNARALGEAATGLAGIARETASQSAMQHDQAMHITTSMSEISTAVHQISETMLGAALDARKAEENAHAGGETIQSTVATIQQLMVANQATATKIEELGRSSDAIGRIIDVIDDIANQTSLLALNASIESARAGEHGRGFAVVASEVRRLAERTGRATNEISETVRAIQGGTAEVVEAMRSSMRHVERGVGSARSAGEALTTVIQGSEAVQRMVTQIASATTEQSYAAQSVNANLNEISSIIGRTTSSSARTVDALERLTHLAADLNELVGAFKVRDQPGYVDVAPSLQLPFKRGELRPTLFPSGA